MPVRKGVGRAEILRGGGWGWGEKLVTYRLDFEILEIVTRAFVSARCCSRSLAQIFVYMYITQPRKRCKVEHRKYSNAFN